MGKIKRVKYKQYAGMLVKGTNPVPLPETDLHMERAAYLAVQLESPKMGTVQSYDRCAMSGGPFHFTAIQPKVMVQGSLFDLLQCIYREALGCRTLTELYDAFEKENWYVTRHGELRDITTNGLIPAKEIRNTFTPMDGKVPTGGVHYKQARYWAKLFHEVLADPKTYRAQMEFAIDYLIAGQEVLERQAYDYWDLNLVRADREITFERDLAMCVYHAHSVNAPGIARKCLKWAYEQPEEKFAKALIWKLGRYKYGRWQDQKGKGKNRYDKTRLKARASGLWDKFLFEGSKAIMPVDLPKEFK